MAMALASATGYLNQVYTRSEHQRRGLAMAAVTRVMAALHKQGVGRCFLMVYKRNRAAIACYERLGFTGRVIGSTSDP